MSTAFDWSGEEEDVSSKLEVDRHRDHEQVGAEERSGQSAASGFSRSRLVSTFSLNSA